MSVLVRTGTVPTGGRVRLATNIRTPPLGSSRQLPNGFVEDSKKFYCSPHQLAQLTVLFMQSVKRKG
eukprot:scaffold248022_cov18-Prasinocladus_malaysianus.AAC.1